MLSLRRRQRRPEIMDQADLQPARHVGALCGLARVNFLSGSAGILWPPLRDLARRLGRPIRILDAASGGGDVPLRLWRRARRAGLDFRIDGCDRSPFAVEHARIRAAAAGADVGFFVADVLSGPALTDYDVVMCSLFLHHLGEEEAVDFLRWAAATAAHRVLVNDLERSSLGLALAHVAVRLLTASDVVHTDGPRSVESAFTMAEARALAERAGLHGAAVQWRWPFRYLLTWSRP
ncbi:MAG TPA: methyltransferase domain-containing protein [Gemmataceae bacterium]|nr:methyltransferase domain-containing protein [Gemmataceae bacterium]